MRSFSRLIVCSTLSKLVAASEDSAMTDFICSFSASRLKGFRLLLALLLRFFLSELELPPNMEPLPLPPLLDRDREEAC